MAAKAWISLFFLSLLPLRSQQYPFRVFDIDQGLPQSTAQTIFQDREGFLWFGTQQGVARYDGIRFTDPLLAGGELINAVRAMAQDQKGRIWLATDEGVVLIEQGKARVYTTVDGLGSDSVNDVVEDGRGDLWFATNGGLTRLSQGTWRNYARESGLPSELVLQLLVDRRGRLWVGTRAGLAVWDGSGFAPDSHGMSSAVILAIEEDAEGGLWVGTEAGLMLVSEGGEPERIGREQGLVGTRVRSLARGEKGEIWVGTDEGLNRIGRRLESAGQTRREVKAITARNGLGPGDVYAVLSDREGNLWVGTELGVYKLRNFAFQNYNQASGLETEAVWSIVESEDALWFGTGGGVSRLSSTGNNHYHEKDGLPGRVVRSLAFSPDGELWAGTTKGLARFDGKRFRSPPAGVVLGDEYIRHLVFDGEGRLWVSTANGGVAVFPEYWWSERRRGAAEGGVPRRWAREEGLENGIFQVFPAQDGSHWAATEQGVARLEGERWRMIGVADGLPHHRVLSIAEGDFQQLWVGTDHGIAVLDGKSARILKSYGRGDGLADEVGYFIQRDAKGGIWVGTNQGVSHFADGRFRNYGKLHGLIYNEMNLHASLLDRAGKLWFGTHRGATRLDPELLFSNKSAPPIRITACRLFDQFLDPARAGRLDYRENYLSFEFVALSYGIPEKIVFRHRLLGLETQWHSGRERTAYYSYLPPGRYEFQVEAINEDGVPSEQPATFAFRISPPFWQRIWFLLAVALTLTGLVFARVKALQTRNRLLASEAELLHRQLEADRAIELSQKAQIRLLHSQMNPHFLQNALSTAIYLVGKDPEEARRILRKLAQIFRLNHQATIDGWSTLEAEKKLIDNYMDIQLARFGEQLRYRSVCDESLLSRKIPGFIIQPLVENAVIHGLRDSLEPMEVVFSCDTPEDSDELRVIVENNGPPMRRPLEELLAADHALGNINKRLQLLYNRALRYEYREGMHRFEMSLGGLDASIDRG